MEPHIIIIIIIIIIISIIIIIIIIVNTLAVYLTKKHVGLNREYIYNIFL